MGRKIDHQNHQPQFPGRHPGCMWGILHVLKYQRWRYIKKRLPHRRPSSTPQDDDHQHPIGFHGEGGYHDNYGWKGSVETQTQSNNAYNNNQGSVGDEKTTKSNSSTKSSIRSRLKSLISDELYRKKGSQHRRSYTCPVGEQQQQHQQQQHHVTFYPQTHVETEKPLPPLPPAAVEVTNDDEHEIETRDVRESKSSIPREGTRFDEDGFRSKEISNALDMAVMNKEFLATILHDRHSHLAPQSTARRNRYYKSMSFPSTSLDSPSLKEPPQKQQGAGKSNEADRLAPRRQRLESHLLDSRSYARSRSMSTITAENRADGISQLIKGRGGGSSRNKTAMRCLKDLKQKIRHVITMEAVLHRIPRGGGGMSSASASAKQQSSSPSNKKEGGKENVVVMMSPRKSYEGDCCKYLLASKSENQRLKRTSSLCESLDKYCQLYDSTFNRGPQRMPVKQKTEDSSSSSISLPAVEKSGAKEDESTSPDDQTQALVEPDVEMTCDDNVVSSTLAPDGLIVMEEEEEKEKEEEEEHRTPVCELSVGESNKDLVDEPMFVIEDEASISEEEAISSPPTFSTFKDSEQILRNLIANKLNFLEDQRAESIIDEIIVAEEEIDEKNEFQSKNDDREDHDEAVEFRVDPNEKPKFDYVKGILDISGFSRKELLGTWHSNDQPVDPAVFEEAGLDSNCYHHHLAMFDLINEVLMEIYAKSHTYCPKPLSWLSQIRPMPVGSHVLKEVWGNVKWSLSSLPDESEQLLDYLVGRDLGKSDGWMNLQFDCECVGLELEDWIFDDLLDELAFEDDPRGFAFR
ncbi:unnamed protein product [Linum trigynum]|uniref:DUF4378 domain-containing protein n=1 Tax=Linum trigynum TaxID=586398 RepID=A0AAV2EYD8_9ROSI